MTLSATELAEVTRELQPLAGGRIQKIDLVAEREAVFEVRVPGRTLRLCISARRGLGRVHLVEKRPKRQIPATSVQALLRQRLGGQLLLALSCEGRTFHLDTAAARLSVVIDGGRDAFRIVAPVPAELPEPTDVPESFEVSDRIADRYADRIPTAVADELRRQLANAVGAKRKKALRLVKNIERDVDKLEKMKAEAKFGELVKTVLFRIERGAKSVRVTDWETSEQIDVPLDPTLGPKGNMERFFKRAKKAGRGMPIARQRLARARDRLAAVDAELERIKTADPEALDRIASPHAGTLVGIDSARLEGRPVKKKDKKSDLDRWARRFSAADGTTIWVGRGAKENDRLTFSGSKADDVWLHARGTAGAHVVIKTGGRAPSPDALLDAAHLAAFYSSAKGDAKAEVIYTEARHVRKTKGAPPGLVGVAKSKTMLVRLDEKRLDRLLGRD